MYNGKLMELDRIETKSISTIDTFLSNNFIIIAMRRLYQKDTLLVKRLYRKWKIKKEKAEKKSQKKYHRYNNNLTIEEFSRTYSRYIPLEFEEFFFRLVSNIDFVTYYISEYGCDVLAKEDIKSIYDSFILDELKKEKYNTSNIEVITLLKSDSMYEEKIVKPAFEDVFWVISIIKRENNNMNNCLENYKEECNIIQKIYHDKKERVKELEQKIERKLN